MLSLFSIVMCVFFLNHQFIIQSTYADYGSYFITTYIDTHTIWRVSQIRYSLVMILGLNSVLEVQYKDIMIDRWWKVSTRIIDVVKSEV